MLRTIPTFVLLALVTLPFTAPFQTFDPRPDQAQAIIDHSGSAVASLATEPGRLSIVMGTAVSHTVLSVRLPVTMTIASTRPPDQAGGGRSLSVLRL